MPTVVMTLTASTPSVPVSIGGGVTVTNAEVFNGAIPGPTINLIVGDTLIVRLVNDLPHPVGIHWHGIELENYSDGTEVTQNEVPGAPLQILGNGVPAGGTFLYKFKVPKAGIFWYHPHHHHSTNRVFRGLYGMIAVKDPAEITLEVNGTLPPVSQQLVLSDITVCKTVSFNDNATYEDPSLVVPASNASEWLSPSTTAQNGPTPKDLCETNVVDEMGMPAMMGFTFNLGEAPNTFRMNAIAPGIPLVVEGQVVLTNGVNVGHRYGTPAAPAGFPGAYSSINVQPGEGVRLQLLNASTTRYFRLILTDSSGTQINLVRVGGEGGILNDAIIEGGTIGSYNTKYFTGEILVPPGSRADVVAVIPTTATGVLTMWTRDYQRVGPVNPGSWSQIPTVPVLHMNVTGAVLPLFTMVNTTPLKSSISASTVGLGAPTGSLLNPASFAPAKPGMSSQNIQLTVAGGGANGIDGVTGSFDGFMPYTTVPHINSSRYANAGDVLQLTIANMTTAHHPFHLHGFSFQPISYAPNSMPVTYTWPYVEFRDNLDIPAGHTLTLKVHMSPRQLADGTTAGGAYGRWLFHCHIFFHAHHGMISELVVTDSSGREKPNVNVDGSWAYAPTGGIATRTGTWSHPDGTATTLSASYGTVVQNIGGTWSWSSPIGAPNQTTYVYIEALDAFGLRDQAVFRLKIGAPDDGSDNGDPHIHTVDNHYYDFQGVGEFILLRDRDGLEIQARQKPVLTANPVTDQYTGLTACVSLNVAVAARVGTHHISYQPARREGQLQFYLDGQETALTTDGFYLDGHRVSGVLVNGQLALRVDYSHHAVLIATPLFWTTHNMWYLNISVYHTHADEGLMGAIPAGTWLPLLPTGASVGAMPATLADRYTVLYQTFANAWRVTDQSSLFFYEPGETTDTFTDRDWPAGQPPCNLKPQFVINAPVPQGMSMAQAVQACQFVTDRGLNRDCIFDMATIGDNEFAEGYEILGQIRWRSTAVQVVSIVDGEVLAIVTFVTDRAVPEGAVTFFVNDDQAGRPVQLNSDGQASWTIDSQFQGTIRVKAMFVPVPDADADPAFSPELELTLPE